MYELHGKVTCLCIKRLGSYVMCGSKRASLIIVEILGHPQESDVCRCVSELLSESVCTKSHLICQKQ